jgi:hypothetical protein
MGKEYLYHFIYKTTNLKNGKYYIGMHSTSDLNDGYIGSGKRLRNSIRYYGKENHEMIILEFLNNRDSLSIREKEIINEELLKDPMCMNIVLGGNGNFPEYCIKGESHLEISRKGGDSIKKRIENDIILKEKYKKMGSDTLKNLHKEGKVPYDNFKGKKHTEETINRMKVSKKGHGVGENNSQFGTCWVFNEISGNKKIRKSELSLYLLLGYIKGRRNVFK